MSCVSGIAFNLPKRIYIGVVHAVATLVNRNTQTRRANVGEASISQFAAAKPLAAPPASTCTFHASGKLFSAVHPVLPEVSRR